MSFIHRICAALEDRGVDYAIVGGHAVALHGAVRGTVDVDLALLWDLETVRKAVDALTDIGLRSRLPLDAEEVVRFRDEYVERRNLIGWNFQNPDNLAEQVDIVINYDLKGKHLETRQTAAGPIRILGLRDLIEMKKAAGRPQDLEDAKALEQFL